MDAKWKKTVVAFAALAIMIDFSSAIMKVGFSNDQNASIDLFTQKTAHDGRGQGVPSDAFAPSENVILYALLTYKTIPVQNVPVVFQVTPPNLRSFSITSQTNSTGVATVTIMTLTEDNLLNDWQVLANALVNGVTVQDIMVFRVDWIVKLLSVRTIDGNLSYRTSFGRDGYVGLEVNLRNIAMVTKNATISMVIQDELNAVRGNSTISDFAVQPNGTVVLVYFKVQISKYAYVGNATATVSLLTTTPDENGVAYCPSVVTDFVISPLDPIAILLHDESLVSVSPSAESIQLGNTLVLSVIMRNEGTEFEESNVTAYFGGVTVTTSSNIELSPYSMIALEFAVDTLSFGLGNFTVSASIPTLANEADLTDNLATDGPVRVVPEELVYVHDVSVNNLTLSSYEVNANDPVNINVTLTNMGNSTESFNVSIYRDFVQIATLQVLNLEPLNTLTMDFVWNTTSVDDGVYQISAVATLPDDIDTSDNTFIDGSIRILQRSLPLHNIAVSSVLVFTSMVNVGDMVGVNVTVKNEGTQDETFQVFLYYDANIATTWNVTQLNSNSEEDLTFNWETGNVSEGNYAISAYAVPVEGEENVADNTLTGGFVTITKPSNRSFVPDWFNWIVLLMLVLVTALLTILLYWRRKKKEDEKSSESFNSGWNAWFYGRQLRRNESTSPSEKS